MAMDLPEKSSERGFFHLVGTRDIENNGLHYPSLVSEKTSSVGLDPYQLPRTRDVEIFSYVFQLRLGSLTRSLLSETQVSNSKLAARGTRASSMSRSSHRTRMTSFASSKQHFNLDVVT